MRTIKKYADSIPEPPKNWKPNSAPATAPAAASPTTSSTPTTNVPTPPAAPPAAPTASKEPIAVRDLMGEEWPINSARGLQEVSNATENGQKPDYVYEVAPATSQHAPAQKAPAVPGQQSVPQGNGGFYQQGLAPVKAMQQALINLSRDIASHSIQSVQDRHSKGDDPSGDLLNGANSFMNFMVSNYMNKAKATGKQLVNTDIGQPVRMETSKENDNFKGILDTIRRIGGQGKEQSPDGDWGVRTNNALQQVYSLAHALMSIVADMGLHLTGYGEGDLGELYAAIPKDITKVSLNDKVGMANIITKNLDKLRGLYDSFRETILDNPTYAAQISQAKPLVIRKAKAGTNPLNDGEKNAYEQYKSTELDATLNGKKVVVMPYDLFSMDNFKKFLNKYKSALSPEELVAVNKGDNQTISKLLGEVSTGLEQ
jgi:hypothetical protein